MSDAMLQLGCDCCFPLQSPNASSPASIRRNPRLSLTALVGLCLRLELLDLFDIHAGQICAC